MRVCSVRFFCSVRFPLMLFPGIVFGIGSLFAYSQSRYEGAVTALRNQTVVGKSHKNQNGHLIPIEVRQDISRLGVELRKQKSAIVDKNRSRFHELLSGQKELMDQLLYLKSSEVEDRAGIDTDVDEVESNLDGLDAEEQKSIQNREILRNNILKMQKTSKGFQKILRKERY